VPFLTATGTYLIAIGGPLAWVELAFKLLGKALTEMGVGAKTSSGYGRMLFIDQSALSSDRLSDDVIIGDIPEATQQAYLTTKPDTAVADDASPAQQPTVKQPKRGQDLWGKVIDRRKGRWIVQLEEGAFEVSANDTQAKRRVNLSSRVRVRIDKTDPLEGSIRDVAG
jgi:hypothetical protein